MDIQSKQGIGAKYHKGRCRHPKSTINCVLIVQLFSCKCQGQNSFVRPEDKWNPGSRHLTCKHVTHTFVNVSRGQQGSDKLCHQNREAYIMQIKQQRRKKMVRASIKTSGCQRFGEGGMNKQNIEGFQGSKNTLYDSVMGNTYFFFFFKVNR